MGQSVNLAAVCIADGFGIFLNLIMLGANIWENERNRADGKYVRMMLIISISACLSNSATFLLDGKPGKLVYLVSYCCNFWLFLSNVILGTLWVMMLIAHISGKRLPKPQIILTLSLDIIGLAGLILNLFYPVIFYISEDNVYHRSYLFWLYIVIESVFILDGIITYLVVRKKNVEAKYFPIWKFVAPVITGIVIQSIFYGISVICPSFSIAICGVVLGMFNESEAETEALRQHEIDSGIILEQKNKLEEQQEQLKQAVLTAESANRAKTEFLFNMSHDIRTPMNAIMGFNAMAKKYLGDREKMSDYLDKIDISSQQLLTLINQVLEMSRIESGKIYIDEQPVNLKERFESMVTVVSAQARSKGLNFNSLLENIKHFNIWADDSRMGQIILNIVGNAIKYTPEGGSIDYIIRENSPRREKYATYSIIVRDTGIGMSTEYQKEMFEPFSREKSSTVSKIQGTGLGMSIVKHLVDIMSGNIRVMSEVGKGTEVEITLDFRIDYKEKTMTMQENTGHFEASFENCRVLLVEDNEMNREIAKDMLEEHHFIVEEAEDGDIALQKYSDAIKRGEAGYYDFILMDVQMPRMNGYDATRAIRATDVPGGRRVPIIAMTANVFDEDRKNAIEAGMDEHLAKPIDINILLDTLARFLK